MTRKDNEREFARVCLLESLRKMHMECNDEKSKEQIAEKIARLESL